MGKIFGKPYAQKFVDGLSSDAKESFASALDDNGDFLRVDLDLGPTALQETYEEDTCAKCALSFGGKELQGVICYASETAYDFVSYEPQDEIRFWEIDAETCGITEIPTHEKVTLGDLRLALGGGAGGGFDPADIPEGDILQNAVLGLNEDGEAVKGSLFGKYVKVLEAPSSIVLTEEQLNFIVGGAFIEGAMPERPEIKNPIFFPMNETSTQYIGMCAYSDETRASLNFRYYFINKASRTLGTGSIVAMRIGTERVYIDRFSFAGKNLPDYPANQSLKTFHFLLDNGNLIWRESNGLYLHTIVFDVGLGNSFTIRLISDSATACAKDAITGNFGIEGATFVNRANMDNIILRPFGANQFNPDVYAFDTATGTYSDNFTLVDVTSDTVTPIG